MIDNTGRAAPPLSPRLFASTALGLTLACAEGVDRALAQTMPSYSSPLPTISVPGAAPQRSPDYKVDQPSLQKLTEPLADTPQSITVVPRQVIEDRAATTFRDAVRNVTGISLAAGEGGAQGDNLTIR